MSKHSAFDAGRPGDRQITLRSPAELADALPYMMGFHPSDSIVLVTLHGRSGRFGGRLRVGIPPSSEEWEPVATEIADCLIRGSEHRGARPDGMLVFLCQDPVAGESPASVTARLRPLAQWLRTACGTLDVPVYEALCISGGRYWSYCCPDARCCPPEGTPLALPGTSVLAAAAAYAGVQVSGTQREIEARMTPRPKADAAAGEWALDEAGCATALRLAGGTGRRRLAVETLQTAKALLERLARAPRTGGAGAADAADDRLVADSEAARVIIGLQDRRTRDRAAQWMEGPSAEAALRLWRSLARRCTGGYRSYAAAPLTLAGWVSWSTGDEPSARVALGLALRADPEYVFARLLHQACNAGLDPETLRHCLRQDQDWPEGGEEPVDCAEGSVAADGGSRVPPPGIPCAAAGEGGAAGAVGAAHAGPTAPGPSSSPPGPGAPGGRAPDGAAQPAQRGDEVCGRPGGRHARPAGGACADPAGAGGDGGLAVPDAGPVGAEHGRAEAAQVARNRTAGTGVASGRAGSGQVRSAPGRRRRGGRGSRPAARAGRGSRPESRKGPAGSAPGDHAAGGRGAP
ncbi:DUF4192 domain-containing protein [Streptomyces sp. NPDC047999]|uniref:DUF4192 domain-containing protein n=1 Tax=Streptomyces sp. NPDC047999 TaxID=3365497 RepID=UPI00371864B6